MKICCGIFYICIYDVFYVVFIVLSCNYFLRNDEINEHINRGSLHPCLIGFGSSNRSENLNPNTIVLYRFHDTYFTKLSNRLLNLSPMICYDVLTALLQWHFAKWQVDMLTCHSASSNQLEIWRNKIWWGVQSKRSMVLQAIWWVFFLS